MMEKQNVLSSERTPCDYCGEKAIMFQGSVCACAQHAEQYLTKRAFQQLADGTKELVSNPSLDIQEDK